MTVRSLTLLMALLMLVSLSGCGTDTKTTGNLGGSGFTTNHFDSTTTSKIIEGYVIRTEDGTFICSDCHKTDPSDVTINLQWAASAHAGHILATGSVQDSATKFSAWTHYDWDKTNDTVAGDFSGRAACQRCHTATGNSNFMNSQVEGIAYDPVNNDFSHLEGWTSSKSSGQNELLYCWGCHKEVENGTLLAPPDKGITTNWEDGSYLPDGSAARLPINVTFQNLGKSNVCMGCHSGLGNIETLMGKAFTPNPDAILSITNATTFSTPKPTATATATHYMNAAATIFHVETKVGYEFPLLNYADPDDYGNPPISYLHRFSNCVACHMGGEESHSFSVAEKDPVTGAITAINSQEACNGCHSSLIPMNAEKLEESRKGYEEALHILENELALDGYVFVNAYPYFYIDANLYYRYGSAAPYTYSLTLTDRDGDGTINSSDWSDFDGNGTIDAKDQAYRQPVSWKTQGDIGTGHNFNYLHHEPGAYAHNSLYAKRLIFDSINWLDNNTMDATISIDADTYPEAAIWFGATAPVSGPFQSVRP